MRVLLQRVTSASVAIDGEITGEIGDGLLLLVGATHGDTRETARKLAQKTANLRIFSDEQGKMNRSLLDVRGGALVVSQFTLYADARKGRRPSYVKSASPDVAEPLVQHFADCLADAGVADLRHGVFGAYMQVSLVNDGPVTIWLDSAEL